MEDKQNNLVETFEKIVILCKHKVICEMCRHEQYIEYDKKCDGCGKFLYIDKNDMIEDFAKKLWFETEFKTEKDYGNWKVSELYKIFIEDADDDKKYYGIAHFANSFEPNHPNEEHVQRINRYLYRCVIFNDEITRNNIFDEWMNSNDFQKTSQVIFE